MKHWLLLACVTMSAPYDIPPSFHGELFAPNIISTPAPESGGTFTPDGNEFYFTVRNPTTTTTPVAVLCVSRVRNGKWQKPEVLPFSGRGFDYAPALSPDGSLLLFTSSRRVDGKPKLDTDLWLVERTPHGPWSAPRRLPSPINSDSIEQGAAIGPDGALYFSSDRPGGLGSSDIYRAESAGHATWGEPKRVDPISSPFTETHPFITRDGRFLFFVSVGRPEDKIAGGAPYARGDLWVSEWANGHWNQPRHLPDSVNTTASETYPFVSPDGRWFYFTSETSPAMVPMPSPMTFDAAAKIRGAIQNGGGNIYRIPIGEILPQSP